MTHDKIEVIYAIRDALFRDTEAFKIPLKYFICAGRYLIINVRFSKDTRNMLWSNTQIELQKPAKTDNIYIENIGKSCFCHKTTTFFFLFENYHENRL